MKNTLLAIFIVMGCWVTADAQNTVWRSQDLYSTEIQNWSELFTLSSSWTNFTADQVGIQYSRNGLAGTGGAWWPVFINGTQIRTQAWDTQSLYTIPFSVSQVDSVVIAESSQIYNGTFLDKGGILIYTKQNSDGWGGQGNLSFGNKSEDPGPFVYTDRVTKNIERVGPVVDGTITYKKDNFGIQVFGSMFDHAASDNFLQYIRMIPFEHQEGSPWRQVKIESTSGYIKSDLRTDIFSHQVQLGTTEAEDYLFAGVYGIEVPVERSLLFGGYETKSEFSDQLIFEAGAGFNSNKVEGFPNKYDYLLYWNQDSWEVRNSFLFSHEKGFQEAGIRGDFLILRDDRNSQEFTSQVIGLYHSMAHEFWEWLTFLSQSQLSFSNQAALKQKIVLSSGISKNHVIEFSTVYSERLPVEDNSLAFWVDNGFFSDELLPFLGSTNLQKPTLIKHSFSWKTQRKGVNADISMESVTHRDEYFIDHEFQPSGGSVLARNQTLITNNDATFFRVPLHLKWKIKNVFHTLGYTYNRQVSGDGKFNTMIPDHRFNYTVNWMLAPSFKIWMRVQAQTEVSWASMKEIDGHTVYSRRLGAVTSETYQNSYPSRLLLDLGIKKYFWDRRVNISMDLRNITDQQFRYSPLSEEHRFTLFLKAGLELP